MKNKNCSLRNHRLQHNPLFSLLTIIVLYLLTINIAIAEDASERNISKYRVRTAFIYNFLKFVTWPDTHSPKDKANLCIIGDAEFARYLPSLQNTNKINVISLVPAGNIAECHILFIGREEETNAASIVAHAGHHAILSISEAKNFADNGGIIEIVRVDKNVGLFSRDKINLRINLKTAISSGLSIDARLLQVAAEVIK